MLNEIEIAYKTKKYIRNVKQFLILKGFLRISKAFTLFSKPINNCKIKLNKKHLNSINKSKLLGEQKMN